MSTLPIPDEPKLQAFRDRVRGGVLRGGDEGYDEARLAAAGFYLAYRTAGRRAFGGDSLTLIEEGIPHLDITFAPGARAYARDPAGQLGGR